MGFDIGANKAIKFTSGVQSEVSQQLLIAIKCIRVVH